MSFDDRDWYREEIRRRHTVARRSDWGFRFFVAIGVAVVLAGIWKVRGIGRPPPQEPPKIVLEPDTPLPRPTPRFENVPPAAFAPPPETVFRCIVDGKVIYAGPMDCRGAMSVIQKPVSTNRGEPAGLTDYQREMLRSADARIARDAAHARREMDELRAARVSGRFECDALAAEIATIDARARQPIAGYEQDALRAQRQAATSRQHALRC